MIFASLSAVLGQGVVSLISREDSSCIDVLRSHTSDPIHDYGNIYGHPCHEDDNQLFTFVPVPGRHNAFYIKVKDSGKCLDWNIHSSSGNVHEWDCHHNSNQQWIKDSTSDGYFRLKSVHDQGKCLDMLMSENSHGKKGNIYAYSCHNGKNQQWRTNAPFPTSGGDFMRKVVFVGIHGCGGSNAGDIGRALTSSSLTPYGGIAKWKYFDWKANWGNVCLDSATVWPDVDKITRYIDEEVGIKPSLVVIAGHSLGGWTSYLVAQHLRRKPDLILTLDSVFSASRARRPSGAIPFHRSWGCGVNWYQAESAKCHGCNPACDLIQPFERWWMGQRILKSRITDEKVRFFYNSDCSRRECHCNCKFCSWNCYSTWAGRVCRDHGWSCQQCGKKCEHGRYTNHIDIAKDPCIISQAKNNLKTAIAKGMMDAGLVNEAKRVDPSITSRGTVCWDYKRD